MSISHTGAVLGASQADVLSQAAAASGSIEIRNLSKRYGEVGVLHDVTCSIAPGTFVTLLGPSGCGKTTLLRLIAGFTDPNDGTIEIDGRNVDGIPTQQRPVGMVFQNLALFPHFSVAENIAYGLKLRKVPATQIARQLDRFMDLVGLTGYGDRRISQLSGGQKQRVALARSLVLEPSILLLDEPLSALDQQLRKQLQFALKDIQRKLNTTFVFVTHDQEEATLMSDVIVVMNDGRTQQIGSPSAIYREPRNLFVARFIGEINELPGKILGNSGGFLTVDSPLGTIQLPTSVATAVNLGEGDACVLCIRPEHVRIGAADEPDTPLLVSAPATIIEELVLGPTRRTTVQVAGHILRSLTVVDDANSLAADGKRGVRFRTTDVRLYPAHASTKAM